VIRFFKRSCVVDRTIEQLNEGLANGNDFLLTFIEPESNHGLDNFERLEHEHVEVCFPHSANALAAPDKRLERWFKLQKFLWHIRIARQIDLFNLVPNARHNWNIQGLKRILIHMQTH
jgi:hypothetical protein